MSSFPSRPRILRDSWLKKSKLLDTEKGSPADGVYPKWGYRQVSPVSFPGIGGMDREV